ncbi:uncharacterized protein RJT20DRAFT_10459 [Scheffersomyces xylosifermentans]|uniref:uncharacterized protein n=1 Tax=Scheffersomyces xylosifermentans TaxID=1304137 RepID=UPI00315D0EB8
MQPDIDAGLPPDGAYIQQHLRSLIIHSLDSFNYTNAEFACERLLAMDPTGLDSQYLYCLTLFRQNKFKSCYSRLITTSDTHEHLGCMFILGKCCLALQKYKEGIYHLLKLNYLYNEAALEEPPTGNDNAQTPINPFFFTTPQQKHQYEFRRSIHPDASSVYHLLGDLYRGMNDTKNSSLNYAQALKFNPYDFAAFQDLCKLGANVRVKSIFRTNQSLQQSIGTRGNGVMDDANVTFNEINDISNPFASSASNSSMKTSSDTPVIHQDDSFGGAMSTPRLKLPVIPDAPLRKSNINTSHGSSSSHFEFTKPSFPLDTGSSASDKKPRRESTYSRITSRLISQPTGTATGTGITNVPSGSSGKDNPAIKSVGTRPGMKRNTSNSIIPINGSDNGSGSSSSAGTQPNKALSILAGKEIEKADRYLFRLYVIFAKSFKSMSKYDCYKAIRLLESLPEREKETPWVLSKLGRLHYEIVNYKQSEYFFIKLRKLDRTRLEDMEYFSTLLWHLHRKVELTYLANELHDLDAESPITWCTIGNLFSLTREPDEAIKCFNRAIKLDEKFTYAYTLKGHEYYGNDNYEMALENFRISLLIDSRHYNAFYGIGMVYINLGDYQKADYHFRKAVSINPINIILICCVGMVLEKLNKKNLALRQYELANKLQPTNPLPIFKKAQLLFSMQQYPQALKYFESLKDLAPDEASVHFLLGQLYNIQNDKFRAIREFTIALNLDPKGTYLIREAMESLKDK